MGDKQLDPDEISSRQEAIQDWHKSYRRKSKDAPAGKRRGIFLPRSLISHLQLQSQMDLSLSGEPKTLLLVKQG